MTGRSIRSGHKQVVIVMSGRINGVAVRWGSTVYMYFVSNDLLYSDLPVEYPQFDLQYIVYSRMP